MALTLQANKAKPAATPPVRPPATPQAGDPPWNASMGAPQNYSQWASYHRQNGTFNANDEARRNAYRSYATSRGLATPWITPGAGAGPAAGPAQPPDSFALDAQGTADWSDAASAYQQATGIDPKTGAAGVGSLAQNRDTLLGQINADRQNATLGWQDADRAVSRNAASRGMYHSGMRQFAMDRNLANLQQSQGLLTQRDTNANNDYLRNTAAAEAAWRNTQATVPMASLSRQMANWYATRGL